MLGEEAQLPAGLERHRYIFVCEARQKYRAGVAKNFRQEIYS
jgi:hypothetical protein